jgi:exodeoxyribonuclease VII large subunit
VTKSRELLIRFDRDKARALHTALDRARRRLDGQAKLLSTLGYHNVLARGFTLVRSADGAMLRHASEVKPGAALDIEFADGHVGAHADPRGAKSEAPAKEPQRKPDEKQGSLL